ncbi:MAG: hypothetical protein AAFX52_05110 [Pseudomonadota bacterium]
MKPQPFTEDHLEDLREQLAMKLKREGLALRCRPLSVEASEALDDLAFAMGVVADEHEAIRLVRQFARALITEELRSNINGV